jgi:hypothetical protein
MRKGFLAPLVLLTAGVLPAVAQDLRPPDEPRPLTERKPWELQAVGTLPGTAPVYHPLPAAPTIDDADRSFRYALPVGLPPAAAQPKPPADEPVHSTADGNCGADACTAGDPCGEVCPALSCCKSAEQFYLEGEFLLWFLRSQSVGAPLVTTGPAGSTGALGQPGVLPISGGDNRNDNPFAGLKLAGGYWFGPDRQFGLEGVGFFLPEKSSSETYRSLLAPTPVIARPFTDALTGTPASVLVAAPGVATGAVSVDSDTRLGGAEANGLVALRRSGPLRWDGLVGFRYVDLAENLRVLQTSQLVGTTLAPFNGGLIQAPAFVSVLDGVTTRNQFWGGQVGTRFEYAFGRLTAGGFAKVALGSMHQVVDQIGRTGAGQPGGPATFAPGGVLVTSTNGGRSVEDRFAVVPEVGLRLGYAFSQRLSGFVGYDFLYLSSVVRPGDQFDGRVNPNSLPLSATFGQPGGPALPAVLHDRTDFWAQGVNFGLAYRY